eukprot:7386839-Prymnesium_polylepis.1
MSAVGRRPPWRGCRRRAAAPAARGWPRWRRRGARRSNGVDDDTVAARRLCPQSLPDRRGRVAAEVSARLGLPRRPHTLLGQPPHVGVWRADGEHRGALERLVQKPRRLDLHGRLRRGRLARGLVRRGHS